MTMCLLSINYIINKNDKQHKSLEIGMPSLSLTTAILFLLAVMAVRRTTILPNLLH